MTTPHTVIRHNMIRSLRNTTHVIYSRTYNSGSQGFPVRLQPQHKLLRRVRYEAVVDQLIDGQNKRQGLNGMFTYATKIYTPPPINVYNV